MLNAFQNPFECMYRTSKACLCFLSKWFNVLKRTWNFINAFEGPLTSVQKFSDGQLRLRKNLKENLLSTDGELRGRVDVNEILLTVPALEGNARDEGETFCKCLETDLP